MRRVLRVERTLMSWVRTAIALIGFGFTIVQFFDRLRQMPSVHPAVAPHASRYFGLGLIVAGVLGLALSIWQYRRAVRHLWDEYPTLAGIEKERQHTPAMLVALALMLIGVFAFVAVLIRVP